MELKLARKEPAKSHVIFSVIPYLPYPREGESFVTYRTFQGDPEIPLATLFRMPKPESREQEEADLAAYTARWLQLADAALSATEKAAKALEIAREEQEHIRRDIKRKLESYGKLKRRKAKKIG